MNSKRKVIFLDEVILKDVDNFISHYVPNPRGRVINVVTSLFLLLKTKEQEDYLVRARNLIQTSKDITTPLDSRMSRKGKIPVELNASNVLNKAFTLHNEKELILAALIYVRIVKDGE